MLKRPKGTMTMLVVLLSLLFLIAGCGQPAQITLDMSANGSQVEMERDQELVIKLESNPTTGFSWAVSGVDTAVLQQIGDTEYEPDETGLVGSGGWESCRFEAVAAGQTTLELVYRRPWEEGVPPEQTFTLDVTVR